MSGADALWAIHIKGPDDIVSAPSKDAAEREAAILNRYFASMRKREHAPTMRAAVVEWPYAALDHTKLLGRDWDKEGNRK
ncbi:hypothetical protein RA280_16640 [Cupriavidus sp. CV2]|uniref:hypothetical protein n=1 Tax=Cupriavidus ulmosensis TaxID=3065913 RepID=UPI00296ADE32|nr:hypothetical protein [Cupriavidus sp. CV2]MDW3683345.1 hypothetical protein [Cupriavidus sp. CV2]